MIISNRCRKQHSFRFFTFCCMDNPCGAALRRCAGPAACGGGEAWRRTCTAGGSGGGVGKNANEKERNVAKKVLAILLAACLALSLAACGGSGSSAPVSTAPDTSGSRRLPRLRRPTAPSPFSNHVQRHIFPRSAPRWTRSWISWALSTRTMIPTLSRIPRPSRLILPSRKALPA